MMRKTLTTLQSMRNKGEKIVVLTCYDASFAALLEANGVDILLVGDSLGMVLQGHESTLPVTLDEMVYHAACVAPQFPRVFAPDTGGRTARNPGHCGLDAALAVRRGL